MKFKVDENLPVEVAELLQQVGHEARTVVDQRLSGRADAAIASICQREGCVLVTLDMDFADIRVYPPAQFPGLIVMRLQRQDKRHVLDTFFRLIRVLSSEPLAQHLWIVEENRIRIRS